MCVAYTTTQTQQHFYYISSTKHISKHTTMAVTEMWTQLGSTIAGVMFTWAMFKQYFPYELRKYLETYFHKMVGFVHPYIQITFHEYTGERFNRSAAYDDIKTYLSANSTSLAKRFKADLVKDSQSVVLSMDDHEEVTDEFEGVEVWWSSNKRVSRSTSISVYPAADEMRFYKLTFHRRHRKIITDSYLNFVLKEGKSISVKNRQRKLYTNCKTEKWGSVKSMWSHVVFEHPASFDTLAMEPNKKNDIINDLKTFSKSKDYYAKIGKAWKRGYLLYGPPGTGKSTMIAAMANLLEYDIYDLELTSVKDNTELRKLLIETSNKSIMVIEDIDCSLDLTGQRKKKGKNEEKKDEEEKDPIKKAVDKEGKNKSSEVTLSGLLNFIDGLWSAVASERIIVFTTNYVNELDPALIRRGRMDKHIELSYCCFDAFKVLAKNYLDIECHDLFDTIRRLLEETDMTPADVAENLMPKSSDDDAESCLKSLIHAIEAAKEEARLKAEEEEKKRAVEEEKAKAEKEEKEKAASDKEEEKNSAGKEVKENGMKENGVIA